MSLETHEIILVVFSGVFLAVFAVSLWRVTKKPEVVYDLQIRRYLARRFSLAATIVGYLLGSAFSAFIGIVFLQEGYLMGWSAIIVAVGPLVLIAFTIHIARLPFTYPDDL